MLNDPFGISVDAYRGWWRTSCSMSTLGLASIIQEDEPWLKRYRDAPVIHLWIQY